MSNLCKFTFQKKGSDLWNCCMNKAKWIIVWWYQSKSGAIIEEGDDFCTKHRKEVIERLRNKGWTYQITKIPKEPIEKESVTFT